MATQNQNLPGYHGGAYSTKVAGMSVGDILSGRNYDLTTAREKIPFVNNWTSALFATAKGLYANHVPDEVYAVYKRQEQEIIATAKANAEMVRAKGEVELRNLRYKHDIEMGSDIIKVSGSGGNMSGSFLDALMQQRKYQMLDEKTVVTNTINQSSAILKEAYRDAANVATQAQTLAAKQKNGVLSAIMAGVDKYFELAFKDKAEAARQDANNETLERREANIEKDREIRYGDYKKAETAVSTVAKKTEYNIIRSYIDRQVNGLDNSTNTYGVIGDSVFDTLNSEDNSSESMSFSLLGRNFKNYID